MNNILLMQRCFDLAQLGRGVVSPNPMVGALLVYDGRIIGEGWHQKYGQAHAEVNAINSVKPENQAFISKSTLFCSLEPCTHFGKTPPCVDLVLKHKIPKVVIANTDPNPLVAGKSIEKLRNAGVEVISGVLEAEGKRLNAAFFKWIKHKTPYIILKWAQSQDGFISKKGEQTSISNPYTSRLVHQWRSECDAILVGTNTALIDNPRLDIRFASGGKSPLRIAIDLQGKIPMNAHLLDDSLNTWIFGKARKGNFSKTNFIETQSENLITDLLENLFLQGKAILLVEGGAHLLNQFIKQGNWDEARIIENTQNISEGIFAPKLIEFHHLEQKHIINDKICTFLLK
jgi:diaminohydroxyphosphoribosylaminopyrimidine deaminase / 5-amino-6-(5-phosphoribosylamino)uracil reductase